jgi:hypothetical protein
MVYSYIVISQWKQVLISLDIDNYLETQRAAWLISTITISNLKHCGMNITFAALFHNDLDIPDEKHHCVMFQDSNCFKGTYKIQLLPKSKYFNDMKNISSLSKTTQVS